LGLVPVRFALRPARFSQPRRDRPVSAAGLAASHHGNANTRTVAAKSGAPLEIIQGKCRGQDEGLKDLLSTFKVQHPTFHVES
jgi:hypothetical protein